MNSNLFENIRLIFFSPNKAWEDIFKYKRTFLRFYLIQVLPVILLYGLALFIGNSLSLMSTATFIYIFFHAILNVIVYLLAFYLSSLVISMLMPYFKASRSLINSGLLILYSGLPFYFSQMVTSMFPSFWFVNILSLYSIYLFYLGISFLLKSENNNNTISFWLVGLLAVIGIHLLLYFAIVLPVFKLL